jgi:hypothetical protein
MDRHGGAILGAVVVIVLLFISPLVGLIALAVVLIVAAILFVTDSGSSPGERPCPRCGQGVKNGVLGCPHCAFDFRTIGATVPPGGADQGTAGPPAT